MMIFDGKSCTTNKKPKKICGCNKDNKEKTVMSPQARMMAAFYGIDSNEKSNQN